MRFHFNDARRHRQAAKALARAMRGLGLDIGHTGALDLAARLYGYADRHELDACLGKGVPGLWDEDEAPGIVAARRERHVAVLAVAGVPDAAIEAVLAAVRPTAGKARAVVRADAAASPSSAVRVMDLLDTWDLDAGVGPGERFNRLVRDAYDSRYNSITVRASLHEGREFEATVAHSLDGSVLLAETPGSIGVTGWLEDIGPGKVIDVPHRDGPIPVRVTREAASSHLREFTCRLVRNLDRRPPTLRELGLPEWRSWEAALVGRTGLHVVCTEEGQKVAEAVCARLAEDGILSHRKLWTFEGWLANASTCQVAEQGPIIVAAGPPAACLIFNMDHDHDRHQKGFDDVVVRSLATGASVVLLSSEGTPRDWIRGMLLRGMETDYLRRALVATGEYYSDADGAAWSMEFHHAPRRPSIPASRSAPRRRPSDAPRAGTGPA